MRFKIYDKENKKFTLIINGKEVTSPIARALITTAAMMLGVMLLALLILISLPLLGVKPGSGLMFIVMALMLMIPVLPMIFLTRALRNSMPPKEDEQSK